MKYKSALKIQRSRNPNRGRLRYCNRFRSRYQSVFFCCLSCLMSYYRLIRLVTIVEHLFNERSKVHFRNRLIAEWLSRIAIWWRKEEKKSSRCKKKNLVLWSSVDFPTPNSDCVLCCSRIVSIFFYISRWRVVSTVTLPLLPLSKWTSAFFFNPTASSFSFFAVALFRPARAGPTFYVFECILEPTAFLH